MNGKIRDFIQTDIFKAIGISAVLLYCFFKLLWIALSIDGKDHPYLHTTLFMAAIGLFVLQHIIWSLLLVKRRKRFFRRACFILIFVLIYLHYNYIQQMRLVDQFYAQSIYLSPTIAVLSLDILLFIVMIFYYILGRWWKIVSTSLLVLILMYCIFSGIYYTQASVYLKSTQDISDSSCRIPYGHSIPWMDIIPFSILNLYTLGTSCPRIKTITTNNILKVEVNPYINYLLNIYSQNLQKYELTGQSFRSNKSFSEENYIISDKHGNTNYIIRHVPKPHKIDIETTLNVSVQIILIDSVSKPHFKRRLPKLHDLFSHFPRKINTNEKFVLYEFLRYQSAGKNTNPNLNALFSGITPNKRNNNRNDPNSCIYGQYSRMNYTIGFVQSCCENMDLFLPHFNISHYDHFHLSDFCHPQHNSRVYLDGVYGFMTRCIDGKHVHNYLLDYMKSFNRNYDDRKTLSWTAFHEAHEAVTAVLNQLDDPFVDYFSNFVKSTNMENTIILFLADHGLRLGPFPLFTNQGNTERSTPFLFMFVPKIILQKYPDIHKNLEHNQYELLDTTDLYHTLSHILSFPDKPKYQSYSSFSLFSPLPKRQCSDLDIYDVPCNCR